MSHILGPDGRPITLTDSFRKEKPPKLGPAFGDWAGREDIQYFNLPGSSVLAFDLSKLTLADFRAMRYNPQINSSLSFLAFMIHQIDWWIDCENKKIKDAITANLTRRWSQLVRGMSQAHWAGYSPMVIDWDNNHQTKYIEATRFKDLVPEEVEVNWKTYEGYAPPGSVKPKFKKYDGIKIRGIGQAQHPIPPENTFWYPMLMENGNYYGRHLLKAAFTPWYFSVLIHLFANRYYERFGEPTRLGRAPLDQTVPVPGGTTIPARTAMEQVMESLRSGSFAVLPNEWNEEAKNYEWAIEHLETQMRGVDFERYMARLDEEISLAIFTPILMFRTGTVGSNALGVQHVKTFLWMLNAIAADMKEYIDAYYVDRFVNYNFGKNAPRAEWQWKPLGKENTETIRAIIQELIRQGGATVDLEELGKAVGMTVKEIKTVQSTSDSEDDPNADAQQDDRVVRDRPGRVDSPPDTSRSGPSGTRSQTVSASREKLAGNIKSRIGGQLLKRYAKQKECYPMDVGYHAQLRDLAAEAGSDDAVRAARIFHAVVTGAIEDSMALGVTPDELKSKIDQTVDWELDRLCGG